MAWKPILIAAAVTLLVAACGGNDSPPGRDGDHSSASASDTPSSDTSDSAVADTTPASSDYIGQPAPSVSADDAHPQTQWKSQMLSAGN